jgi:hypothetical protein
MKLHQLKSVFVSSLILLVVVGAHAAEITVFAAVSLTDSLKQITSVRRAHLRGKSKKARPPIFSFPPTKPRWTDWKRKI